MKKVVSVIIAVVLILGGLYIYKNNQHVEKPLPDLELSKLAIEAVINDGRRDWLKRECASVEVLKKDPGAMTLLLREVHNPSCGGDENTAPLITVVIVNTRTGEIFDQPAEIDIIDQGWRTIQIDGRDYRVTKKLTK